MKHIYVNNEILKEAVDYLNDEITFFGFLSHVKFFLKQLLHDPINANVDEYLEKHNIQRNDLINKLLERGIIIKETNIIDINKSDKFSISYKIPKKNFERKIRRLFISLFEKNEIQESTLFEDGASSCGSCMQGGGGNPDSGQYVKPFGNIQRRKIYITDKQSDFLKETNTQNVGDYQYDTPINFNKGKDLTYNHKNIIDSGIPKKRVGIRNKKR